VSVLMLCICGPATQAWLVRRAQNAHWAERHGLLCPARVSVSFGAPHLVLGRRARPVPGAPDRPRQGLSRLAWRAARVRREAARDWVAQPLLSPGARAQLGIRCWAGCPAGAQGLHRSQGGKRETSCARA